MKKAIVVASTAAAVLWCFSPAGAQQPMRDKADRAKDKIEQKADRTADKTESATERAKDKTESVVDKAKDKAHAVKEKIASKMSRSEARASSQEVRDVQDALRAKGFGPGPSDGRFGPKTRAALQDYQKAENLDVTGRIDDATATHLNVQHRATTDTSSASPATDINRPRQKP